MRTEAEGGESLAGKVALVVEGDPQVAAAICDGLAAALAAPSSVPGRTRCAAKRM